MDRRKRFILGAAILALLCGIAVFTVPILSCYPCGGRPHPGIAVDPEWGSGIPKPVKICPACGGTGRVPLSRAWRQGA